MRLSKGWIEKYDATSRSTGRHSALFRVRWRVYLPDGTTKEIKKGGFKLKGHADVWIENLAKADLGIDGWTLNAAFHPVRDTPLADLGPTVVESVTVFVRMNWASTWKTEDTMAKNRGRLLRVVGGLLDDAGAAGRVVAALSAQNPSKHGSRKLPTTVEGWAARYLHEHGLCPTTDADGEPTEPSDDDLGPEMAAARRWRSSHSARVRDLDDAMLVTLRDRLTAGCTKHSSKRTYWATVAAYLRWLVASRRLERDPTAGMTQITRDLDGERVDVDCVPTEAEAWELSKVAAAKFGHMMATLIVVVFFCSLRISEAAGLRRCDVRFRAKGGAFVTMEKQHKRVNARYSPDGKTTHRRTPAKGRLGPGSRRKIYLPARAASPLKKYMDLTSGDPTSPLFEGARGGAIDPDYIRRERWGPIVAAAFPGPHRLNGITPHALRHGGMTMWLRNGVPFKLIQRWGGWSSLKVMLDVYAAVLPDDIHLGIAAMERGSANPGLAEDDDDAENGEVLPDAAA